MQLDRVYEKRRQMRCFVIHEGDEIDDDGGWKVVYRLHDACQAFYTSYGITLDEDICLHSPLHTHLLPELLKQQNETCRNNVSLQPSCTLRDLYSKTPKHHFELSSGKKFQVL